MHERFLNQAAGLMGLAKQAIPRLNAVVSHGDALSELPLLWKLCAAIVDLGFSVTVLDGTTAETPDNPGLEQILDYTFWRDEVQECPHWSIVPSQQGLESLSTFSRPASHCLSTLGHAFPQDGILIVYSSARLLSTLLPDSGLSPLLPVSQSKTSLLTSYMALKRLLVKGGMEPRIANVVQYDNSLRDGGESVANNLADCAKYFLDFDVKISTIVAPTGEDRPGMDLQRAALAMIESAIALDTAWSAPPMRASIPASTLAARSH
jgi:hypothetical protein